MSEPRWKVRHHPTCDVTRERRDLWDSFVRDPTNPGLQGALIEYDNGGDQEVENCTCRVYPGPSRYETTLSQQARAVAIHMEAFADLVARDSNTHDGAPRGQEWDEGTGYASYHSLINEALQLRNLADLWDRG